MTSLLVKNVPEALKRRLRAEANRDRRSMNQQVLLILEQALPPGLPPRLPTALRPRRRVTAAMIHHGIRAGRE